MTPTDVGSPIDLLEQFHWEPQPKAQTLINEVLVDFLSRCPGAKVLSERMTAETGTRFVDWIDHVQLPSDPAIRNRVIEVGYTAPSSPFPIPAGWECFVNTRGLFPAILLTSDPVFRVAIKVEFIDDFLAALGVGDSAITGEPCGRYRSATVFGDAAAIAGAVGGCELLAVERHGYRGFVPPEFDAATAIKARRHLENLRRRRRDLDSDQDGFAEANRLVDGVIADLGRDWACDLFFAAERDYWMRRNRAAQVQFARQQRLGLGWANHDHHTYRVARANFTRVVALWEKLGFACRERFYAGHEAQWGAQVMEQPVTGITTFNDVDMSPEELLGDFSHDGFAGTRDKLGTVGLWVGLHGEAILQAGMHHLEAMFDFHALAEQLEKTASVKTMAPFTTFPYLRQAFTEGETWPVAEKRIARLLEMGYITPEQAEMFRRDGALGSHLENLERNDGFKGFNQQGVSDIIARTDPRRQARWAVEAGA